MWGEVGVASLKCSTCQLKIKYVVDIYGLIVRFAEMGSSCICGFLKNRKSKPSYSAGKDGYIPEMHRNARVFFKYTPVHHSSVLQQQKTNKAYNLFIR